MSQCQKQNDSDNSLGSWILVLILLFACWPVGLFLLFKKLSSLSPHPPKRRIVDSTATPVYDLPVVKPATPASRCSTEKPVPQKAHEKKQRKKDPLAHWGKGLIALGTTLSVAFALVLAGLIGDLAMHGFYSGMLTGLILSSGLFATGIVLAYCGIQRRKQANRFRRYHAMIGTHESISIDTLASAMPVSYRKACEDLQSMLNLGLLPTGYVDSAKRLLVLTDRGIQEDAPAPKPESKPAAGSSEAVLREIRVINDAIPDQVMTRKIDRIEEITGKILDFQKQHPESDSQLRSFLDYYLPTTLKILRSYAQLEAQGVEGNNISAAKERIEGMMDKVVEGFENRLDQLFRNDALDITSDVAVMEQMLERDGLTHTDDLHLEL